MDCECPQLRAKVIALEAEVKNLKEQLATLPRLSGNDSCGAVSNLATGATAGTTDGDRILLPTFPWLRPLETTESSFLSSPWRLWEGLASDEPPPGITGSPEQPLSEDQGQELVDAFFLRRWPQYPILHRPTFMEQHYGPFSQGESYHTLSPFLVNIVLAIGASERSRTATTCHVSHQSFFNAAIQSLEEVLRADDLACIQCLLLLCMYGSNEPQSVNLWYTLGLALRLVIGINLHRQESVATKSLLDAEMAKRIFWSAYNMDRSISIAMGRPLGVQDADITTPLPLCLTDDMLSQRVEMLSMNLVPDPKDMSTFLHIIRLRRITAEIYRTLHSAGDTNLTGEGLEAFRTQQHDQLNQWLASALRYLSPTSMNQTPEWCQIAYHQAIMNLYRPSHASPLATLEAIRFCADSSISLITNYGALYAKNKIIYSFVALTSLFMAAVTMLYSLRASATLRTELTRDVVDSNVRMCATLLRDISNGRAVGKRGAQIIQRLGDATLPLFDTELMPDAQIDTEFMSWFGLKSQHLAGADTLGQTPSVDLPWSHLLDSGFELGEILCSDVLV